MGSFQSDMSKYQLGQVVPMKDWGPQHWACFYYIQGAALSVGGFQIGLDPHMLAAVKNRLNLAENPIKGSHGQKRACAMQALCHG